MIAANIGAGSTVGAAGLAYRDGLSAWWWVGSAGLGSLVFAFSVAPRLWRVATEHNFYTTGDYLEYRYGTAVRCVAAVLVGLGTLALLAGQLIAGAAILNVLTGIPRWAGALVGGGIMTIYFTAGGLAGSARVNILQLAVMMAGFALALPIALQRVGGFAAFQGPALPPSFVDLDVLGRARFRVDALRAARARLRHLPRAHPEVVGRAQRARAAHAASP